MSIAEVASDVAASGKSHATIVGFGSLLSERSARGTCPNLINFRIVRVKGWRRVFQHVAAIFWERGIVNASTKEMASLSAEPISSSRPESGFVAATFDVPKEELPALLEREEEFDFAKVPFFALDEEAGGGCSPLGEGFMCIPSTDAEVLDARGHRVKYSKHLEPAFGFTSVWDHWSKPDSGILPCPVYCRHCVLATRPENKVPAAAATSFLDETFLVDRKTTLRQHLAANPHVMASKPPAGLEGRYSG